MSAKNFYFDYGVADVLKDEKYKGLVDGKDYGTNPVEFSVVGTVELQIQGWHAIDEATRNRIISELMKRGWRTLE